MAVYRYSALTRMYAHVWLFGLVLFTGTFFYQTIRVLRTDDTAPTRLVIGAVLLGAGIVAFRLVVKYVSRGFEPTTFGLRVFNGAAEESLVQWDKIERVENDWGRSSLAVYVQDRRKPIRIGHGIEKFNELRELVRRYSGQ